MGRECAWFLFSAENVATLLQVGLLARRVRSDLRVRFTFPSTRVLSGLRSGPSLTVAEPRRTCTGFPVMPVVGTLKE
jgi:hypothetical protein